MNINLKQVEIAQAIRNHLASQGINLVCKKVDIQFTATRGGMGIIADINIEDEEVGAALGCSSKIADSKPLPPLKTLAAEGTKTVGALVAAAAVDPTEATQPKVKAKTAVETQAAIEKAPEPEVTQSVVTDMATGEPLTADAESKPKVASLFG